MSSLLGLIVLFPLLGFLFNGVLATRLGGRRLNESAVNVVACALPLASFVLTVVGTHSRRTRTITWEVRKETTHAKMFDVQGPKRAPVLSGGQRGNLLPLLRIETPEGDSLR